VRLQEWLEPAGVPLPLIHAAAGVAADFFALPFWVPVDIGRYLPCRLQPSAPPPLVVVGVMPVC
jgi:hypothetical protein